MSPAEFSSEDTQLGLKVKVENLVLEKVGTAKRRENGPVLIIDMNVARALEWILRESASLLLAPEENLYTNTVPSFSGNRN